MLRHKGLNLRIGFVQPVEHLFDIADEILRARAQRLSCRDQWSGSNQHDNFLPECPPTVTFFRGIGQVYTYGATNHRESDA